MIATAKGNIKQYLWPLQPPTNPSPPEVFTQHVSSHKIISLKLDVRLTSLYALSENGSVIQLQISQYINNELMPYVFIFSEKTINDEMQKREFTDRTYFMDSFTPTEVELTESSRQNIEEL